MFVIANRLSISCIKASVSAFALAQLRFAWPIYISLYFVSNSLSASVLPQQIDSASAEFVRDAIVCNRMHIQQALLAKERSQNKGILNLAETLLSHHKKIDIELKQLAAMKRIAFADNLPVDKLSEISKLTRLKGGAFDKEYLRMMEASHRKAQNFYQKGVERALDASVKAFASRSLPALGIHFQTIKLLQKSI